MKFVAACLAFLLTLCTIIWLMIKMAGAGMPPHPLDQEKPRIEYLMQMEERAEVKEGVIELEEYADYFQQKEEEENREDLS
ncbi:MAG: hypothetical protein AAFY71_11400 [Bacteroidota bacterium]